MAVVRRSSLVEGNVKDVVLTSLINHRITTDVWTVRTKLVEVVVVVRRSGLMEGNVKDVVMTSLINHRITPCAVTVIVFRDVPA